MVNGVLNWRGRKGNNKKFGPFLDLCVSSLRRGHANLLCTVPILSDVPKGTMDCSFHTLHKLFSCFLQVNDVGFEPCITCAAFPFLHYLVVVDARLMWHETWEHITQSTLNCLQYFRCATLKFIYLAAWMDFFFFFFVKDN